MAADAPEINLRMFAAPAMMLGMRFFKVDLSAYVIPLRCLYFVATLTTLACFVYIARLAQAKKNLKEITVTEKLPTETKVRKLTISEYDVEECMKKVKSGGVAFLVVCFIHFKWGSPIPLLLQSIMQLVNLTDDPLVQIHLFGKTAVGKLNRPFKVNNPLADLLKGGEPAKKD